MLENRNFSQLFLEEKVHDYSGFWKDLDFWNRNILQVFFTISTQSD